MEPDFQSKRKKRVVLWQAVLQKIKDIDLALPFSRDDISRKFLNFMVTYKRIKKRNNTSGEAATACEYFDELDKVHGSRSDITVPESNLDSSMCSIFNSLTNESAESDFSFSENIGAAPPRKRSRNVLDFLQNESTGTYEKELLNEKIEIEKLKLDEIKKRSSSIT
uniref:Myb/SANT-like DNA-binding domain-containing protein n=1 Tax=Bactrocera dorsalis TaxID=27457 RepID=A0A034WXH0_BACDO